MISFLAALTRAIPILDKWAERFMAEMEKKRIESIVRQSNDKLDETSKKIAESNGSDTPPDPAVIKARRDELNSK